MTTFLIYYSDSFKAERSGFPKAGTTVEIETLADLDTLSARLNGESLIIRKPDEPYQAPSWAEYLDIQDEDDHRYDHSVEKLPDGWENMRWLEVYNGYRE